MESRLIALDNYFQKIEFHIFFRSIFMTTLLIIICLFITPHYAYIIAAFLIFVTTLWVLGSLTRERYHTHAQMNQMRIKLKANLHFSINLKIGVIDIYVKFWPLWFTIYWKACCTFISSSLFFLSRFCFCYEYNSSHV